MPEPTRTRSEVIAELLDCDSIDIVPAACDEIADKAQGTKQRILRQIMAGKDCDVCPPGFLAAVTDLVKVTAALKVAVEEPTVPDDLGYPDEPVLRVTPDPGGDPFTPADGLDGLRYEDERADFTSHGRCYVEGPFPVGRPYRLTLAQPGTVEVTVLRDSPDGPVVCVEVLRPTYTEEPTDG